MPCVAGGTMAAIAAVASVLGSFDSSSALTLTVTVASAALPGCVLALSLRGSGTAGEEAVTK